MLVGVAGGVLISSVSGGAEGGFCAGLTRRAVGVRTVQVSAKCFMSEVRENNLKERVRAFWQAHPCGTKFSEAEVGSRRFFEAVEEHRYRTEWHIPEAAGFDKAEGLRVLEIGCGLGTDGARFARAGAIYTGVDLTDAAVSLARRRFELEGLAGEFRAAGS